MAYPENEAQLVRENEALRQQLKEVLGRTPLEIAQRAFEAWLRQVDAKLEEAQLRFEEGMGAATSGDLQACGLALAHSNACVRTVRREIAGALAQGA